MGPGGREEAFPSLPNKQHVERKDERRTQMVCVELVLRMEPWVYENRSNVTLVRTKLPKLRAVRSWLESKAVADAIRKMTPVGGANGPVADIVQRIDFDPHTDVFNIYVRFFSADGGDTANARSATGQRLIRFLECFRREMEDPVSASPTKNASNLNMKLMYRSVSLPYFVSPLTETDD